MAQLELIINGRDTAVESDPERTLLEVLREDLQLTGTKYGCGEGACGACTVLIDGRRTHSCSITVDEAAGKEITTIEGLSTGDALHPVQEAFLAEKAFQCGYCTSGMILSAVALLEENPSPSDDEISESMNPNLCRCCGYVGICAAVRRASEQVARR